MALSLTAIGRAEKNKLSTDSAMIILLEIQLADSETILRICRNNEDVEWDGELWQAFPFELANVEEDTSGSLPSFDLKVDNTSQAISYYIEDGNGGNRSTVILRVVNSKALDVAEPEIEEYFSVNKCSVTEQWVTFNLGSSYPTQTRRPWRRYLKNFCPFRYKGVECGATSSLEGCNHTITDCRKRDNSKRFGGFMGIPQGGSYV